ncbi:MAG: hypothetical protein Q7S62_00675 [bacterium]|nr:hypothetical protein [bacterium]
MYKLFIRQTFIFCIISAIATFSTTVFAGSSINPYFTSEECAAIGSTLSWSSFHSPPGCDIRHTEYSEDIDDVNISGYPLYKEGLTLLRFSSTAEAKTHLNKVVVLLEENMNFTNAGGHISNNTYKTFPTEKETVTIGDDGVIITGEISSHLNRASQIKNSLLDNYENGWTSSFYMHLVAQKGPCVLAIAGQTSLNSKDDEYHFIKFTAPNTNDIVNMHPGFDHGRARLFGWLKQEGNKLEKAVTPYCGDTNATPAPPIPSKAPTPPAESVPEVEALVENRPTAEDIPKQINPPTEDQKRKLEIVEFYKSETKVIQYEYGTQGETLYYRQWVATQNQDFGADVGVGDEWSPALKGQVLTGDFIFSVWYGYRAKLKIGGMDIIVEGPIDLAISENGNAQWKFSYELSDTVNQWRSLTKERFDFEPVDSEGVEYTPYMRFLEGTFETDMMVSPPNSTASPAGTDFAVSYDKKSGLAIYEIYDGLLLITSTLTGERKTISSYYGAPIKRIEVSKDGQMTEQVAIPKDEWRARKAEVVSQAKPQENRGGGLFWISLVLVFGGGAFILHKKGKLQPIIQKVLALIRRNKSS